MEYGYQREAAEEVAAKERAAMRLGDIRPIPSTLQQVFEHTLRLRDHLQAHGTALAVLHETLAGPINETTGAERGEAPPPPGLIAQLGSVILDCHRLVQSHGARVAGLQSRIVDLGGKCAGAQRIG
jgi:hypothetical protein